MQQSLYPLLSVKVLFSGRQPSGGWEVEWAGDEWGQQGKAGTTTLCSQQSIASPSASLLYFRILLNTALQEATTGQLALALERERETCLVEY